MGTLHARNNDLDAALREFGRATLADPENLEAQDSYARLAAIYPNAIPTMLRDALARANHAVSATNRSNPAYLDTLAMVHHRMGDHK